MIIVKVVVQEVPTNFVPAVAVIRGEQVLFKITGRKGRVDGFFSILDVGMNKKEYTKSQSKRGVGGIQCIKVKFVVCWRLTTGEGDQQSFTDVEAQKHREQTGLDTLVVYAVTDGFEIYYCFFVIVSYS